jgi:ribose 5-phosphate isomerase B
MLRISIASDHRGVHIKGRLVQTLNANGFTVFDEGTHSDQAVDYPDFAKVVAQKVSRGEADRGILICGTGIGMSIAANKFPGVRAASCYDEVMVEMSRRHNDVNVLCLPGDMIGERPIDDLVLMWLNTEFDGGRHAQRVKKIAMIENKGESSAENAGVDEDVTGVESPSDLLSHND